MKNSRVNGENKIKMVLMGKDKSIANSDAQIERNGQASSAMLLFP